MLIPVPARGTAPSRDRKHTRSMREDGSAPILPMAVPRFTDRRSASPRASAAARGSSKKRDTRCEVLLRKRLWNMGLRYRVDVKALRGRPDLVFSSRRVVVFIDGDFWHGRDLETRMRKLAVGHNAPYWIAKIRTNVERDRRNDRALAEQGWQVLRLWETDILRDVAAVAEKIRRELESLSPTLSRRS
jgi:DNA mismatch endonuclease (patch repair protein)